MLRFVLCVLVLLCSIFDVESFYFEIEIDCRGAGEETNITFIPEVKGLLLLSVKFGDDSEGEMTNLVTNTDAGVDYTFTNTYRQPGEYFLQMSAKIRPLGDPQAVTTSQLDRRVKVERNYCEVQGPLPPNVKVLPGPSLTSSKREGDNVTTVEGYGGNSTTAEGYGDNNSTAEGYGDNNSTAEGYGDNNSTAEGNGDKNSTMDGEEGNITYVEGKGDNSNSSDGKVDNTTLLTPAPSNSRMDGSNVASATRAVAPYQGNEGLSAGGKAGIALGCLMLLCALIPFLICCCRRKKDRQTSEERDLKEGNESVGTESSSEEKEGNESIGTESSSEELDGNMHEHSSADVDRNMYGNGMVSNESRGRKYAGNVGGSKIRGVCGQLDEDELEKYEKAVDVHRCVSGCCSECMKRKETIQFVSTEGAGQPHAIMESFNFENYNTEEV